MKYSKRAAVMIMSLILALTMMPLSSFADDEGTSLDAAVTEESADEDASQDAAVTEGSADLISSEDAQQESADDASDAASDEEIYDDEEYDESDVGYEELSFGEGIDPDELDGAETEELVDDFFASDTDDEEADIAPITPLSVKGDRLSGNALTFYNYYKAIIKEVFAADTSAASMKAYKKVKLKTILGKRTFTASELGVSRIGYKKNGVWYVTDEAASKINALITTSDWSTSWKKIYTGLLSDLSSESYWVDWYSNSNPSGGKYQFIKFNCPYTYNATSLTFKSSDTITFRLPVIKECRYNDKVFYASTSSIKSAQTAKNNAKSIVKTFDSTVSTFTDEYGFSPEQVDCIRMLRYCEVIADLNTYDNEAATANADDLGGPWSMIYVFDGDSSTNAVCAGYARAFKYLCDLSDFESDWIDCQIVTGDAGGQHMWNIVRMHDGLNYLVDPTWFDKDTNDEVDSEWFLRGAVSGDANSFTIEHNDDDYGTVYYTRTYDDWVKSTFASAERELSTNSYYSWLDGVEVIPIVLQKPTIKTPAAGKGCFKAKWKKMSTPLGALYVDGYQVRYSTKKNMSGAKKVTVKGYNKVYKKIKKLKRKKYYYIQVRTYAKMGGHTYFSPWSAKKRVKTK